MNAGDQKDSCRKNSLIEDRGIWNLAHDDKLLERMRSVSQTVVNGGRDIINRLSHLDYEFGRISTDVGNIQNTLLNLSDKQFIESKIKEDDNIETKCEEVSENKGPVDCSFKLKEALENGFHLLDSEFDLVEVNASSDSDEEAVDLSNRPVFFKSRNAYANRTLPFLIGSSEFSRDDNVGLVRPSPDSPLDACSTDNSPSDMDSSSEISSASRSDHLNLPTSVHDEIETPSEDDISSDFDTSFHQDSPIAQERSNANPVSNEYLNILRSAPNSDIPPLYGACPPPLPARLSEDSSSNDESSPRPIISSFNEDDYSMADGDKSYAQTGNQDYIPKSSPYFPESWAKSSSGTSSSSSSMADFPTRRNTEKQNVSDENKEKSTHSTAKLPPGGGFRLFGDFVPSKQSLSTSRESLKASISKSSSGETVTKQKVSQQTLFEEKVAEKKSAKSLLPDVETSTKVSETGGTVTENISAKNPLFEKTPAEKENMAEEMHNETLEKQSKILINEINEKLNKKSYESTLEKTKPENISQKNIVKSPLQNIDLDSVEEFEDLFKKRDRNLKQCDEVDGASVSKSTEGTSAKGKISPQENSQSNLKNVLEKSKRESIKNSENREDSKNVPEKKIPGKLSSNRGGNIVIAGLLPGAKKPLVRVPGSEVRTHEAENVTSSLPHTISTENQTPSILTHITKERVKITAPRRPPSKNLLRSCRNPDEVSKVDFTQSKSETRTSDSNVKKNGSPRSEIIKKEIKFDEKLSGKSTKFMKKNQSADSSIMSKCSAKDEIDSSKTFSDRNNKTLKSEEPLPSKMPYIVKKDAPSDTQVRGENISKKTEREVIKDSNNKLTKTISESSKTQNESAKSNIMEELFGSQDDDEDEFESLIFSTKKINRGVKTDPSGNKRLSESQISIKDPSVNIGTTAEVKKLGENDKKSSPSDTKSSISSKESLSSDTKPSISDTKSAISCKESLTSDTKSSISDRKSSVTDKKSSGRKDSKSDKKSSSSSDSVESIFNTEEQSKTIDSVKSDSKYDSKNSKSEKDNAKKGSEVGSSKNFSTPKKKETKIVASKKVGTSKTTIDDIFGNDDEEDGLLSSSKTLSKKKTDPKKWIFDDDDDDEDLFGSSKRT